jgi:hypothetical protein
VKRFIAGGIGGAAALMVMLGTGSAHANDEYAGMTYAQAMEYINGYGGASVIGTREGSYLPTEECIVISNRKQNGKVLFNLNCNDTSALNGHPGNSVASPEGKKALQARDTAKSLNEDYAAATAAGKQSYCEQNAESCASFCQTSGEGLCSQELMQALGL